MNISVFESRGQVFTNCECVNGYAFINVLSREKCAHFYRVECLSPCNSCA